METARDIKNKLATLREEMRNTLDRTKQPAILTQIMKEIGKLRAVYGVGE